MGYFFRYFLTSDPAPDYEQIAAALRAADPGYDLTLDPLIDAAALTYRGERLALVEINLPGDEMFEDDVAEFRDLVGAGASTAEAQVLAALAQVRALIAVEAFWAGDDAEPVLSRIDSLWAWLFGHHNGLLQADGEGFYDADGLVLQRHFTL